MNNTSLPIQPFTDVWLDCRTNNLIAMLVEANPVFRQLPYLISGYFYNKHHDVRLFDKHMFNMEFMFPFEAFIDTTVVTVSNQQEAHEAIREGLEEGDYLFVNLDRYYYPTGYDSNQIHRIHPAFIYDFSDTEQTYMLLEDCIEIGKIDVYRLAFSDFDHALVLDSQAKAQIWRCRPKQTAKLDNQSLIPPDYRIPGLYAGSDIPNYAISNELRALTGTEERLYGVEALKHTANHLKDMLSEVNQAGLITLKKSVRRPFFYHSARIQLPALLRSSGLISPSDEAELIHIFKQHSDLWETGSYLIMFYTLKKERGLKINPDMLDQLEEKFLELYEAELGLQQIGLKVDEMLLRS
ncbi:hypothetical protein AK95_15220 [Paenibacillus sp. LC231]|uniref:hypothetical protein n=1 Tax=Paenibacillus sp. LC231 TaxID=1120679 RepID=UPI0008DCD765|nr:hypothetical protein [Paenibacillus sp. LC231]OIB04957.1 hypothetical protein AK95_15220 [Paenibacillus sp. LC231]